MEEIRHLWNVVNRLSSISAPEARGLQSFYVARCRGLENEIELPKNIFGSGAMCSYCGSLWSQVDHRVRLGSSKKPGKSISRIINGGNKKGGKKFIETLVKKAVKNSGNRAMIRCSFCSKLTVINMARPKRQKPRNEKLESIDNHTPFIKKRKKRTKDKTAGLIITPETKTPDLKQMTKPKSTNLNKLGAMVKTNLTPAKKSSLHDFIIELG